MLAIARTLVATQGQGRPKQAELRCAVSTAYYALFHFLIDESTRSVVGADHALLDVRRKLGRAFNHGEMKNVAQGFVSGQPRNLRELFAGARAVPPEVRDIADVFVVLQDARHRADYDLSFKFQRSQVDVLIEKVETSIAAFRNATASEEKKIFLTVLLAGARIRQ